MLASRDLVAADRDEGAQAPLVEAVGDDTRDERPSVPQPIRSSPIRSSRVIRVLAIWIETAISGLICRPPIDARAVKWQQVSDELAEEEIGGAELVTLSDEQRATARRLSRALMPRISAFYGVTIWM